MRNDSDKSCRENTFSQQQWLRERASVLRGTYIACVVSIDMICKYFSVLCGVCRDGWISARTCLTHVHTRHALQRVNPPVASCVLSLHYQFLDVDARATRNIAKEAYFIYRIGAEWVCRNVEKCTGWHLYEVWL
jgi:hypothetical protein